MEPTTVPASFEKVVEGAFQALQITDKPVGGTDVMTYKERHEIELEKLAMEVEELPTVIDKRTRQLNQDQLTKLVRTGSRLDDLRIDTFRPITNLKKEWDRYIGTTKDAGLRGRIAAMEQAVKKNIEAYDQAEERKRQEEIRKQEEKNTERRKQLLARKMSFDGTTFTFEQFTAQAEQVYAATDENFAKVLVKLDALVAAKVQREADELAEKKRREAEQEAEAARLKAENERLEAERKKLDDERAEFNRQKEEREAKERGDHLFEVRSSYLRTIGAIALPDANGQLIFGLGLAQITEGDMRTASEEYWLRKTEWFRRAKEESEERKAVAASIDAIDTEAAAPIPDGVYLEDIEGVTTPAPVEEVPFTEEPPAPEVLTEQDEQGRAADEESEAMRVSNELPLDEFSQEPLTVESAVYQALGEASVCWDPRPTGIFDSTRCKAVGDKLMETLKQLAIIHN